MIRKQNDEDREFHRRLLEVHDSWQRRCLPGDQTNGNRQILNRLAGLELQLDRIEKALAGQAGSSLEVQQNVAGPRERRGWSKFGDFAGVLDGPGPSLKEAPGPASAASGHRPFGTTLDNALAVYLKDRGGEVSALHLANVRQQLGYFRDGLKPPSADVALFNWRGMVRVTEVSRAHLRDHRDRLKARFSPGTVNQHTAALRAFFAWTVREGLRTTNPAEGLKVRQAAARDQRRAFTVEQVRAIEWETLKRPTPSDATWIPLIMAYSGMRPEEVAQLRVGDLRETADGGWVFDLTAVGPALPALYLPQQRRKNAASRRLVPIHKTLRAAGVLRLREVPGPLGVRTLRNEYAPLFPLLVAPSSSGRLAARASRHFNEVTLRKTLGIADKRLTLYSLRHSVVTHLRDQGHDPSLIGALVGHTQQGETLNRYAKGSPLAQLRVLVDSINWEK